jgi:hypothetical protein
VWICFPGILLAHGIALVFDFPAMRIADKAIESAPKDSGQLEGIKRWDLVGVNAALKIAELATASIAAIYYVRILRHFLGCWGGTSERWKSFVTLASFRSVLPPARPKISTGQF